MGTLVIYKHRDEAIIGGIEDEDKLIREWFTAEDRSLDEYERIEADEPVSIRLRVNINLG